MPQEQIQKQQQHSKNTKAEEIDQVPDDQRDQTLSDDVDTILDEIDNVLEENAEEFVRSYVQKGGE